jgi:hypothetical protein
VRAILSPSFERATRASDRVTVTRKPAESAQIDANQRFRRRTPRRPESLMNRGVPGDRGLRALSLWEQGVVGSNPAAPTSKRPANRYFLSRVGVGQEARCSLAVFPRGRRWCRGAWGRSHRLDAAEARAGSGLLRHAGEPPRYAANMPRLEGDQKQALKEVWVYLSDAEALDLWRALDEYFSETQPRGWHCHVTDSEGRELTVAVGEPE